MDINSETKAAATDAETQARTVTVARDEKAARVAPRTVKHCIVTEEVPLEGNVLEAFMAAKRDAAADKKATDEMTADKAVVVLSRDWHSGGGSRGQAEEAAMLTPVAPQPQPAMPELPTGLRVCKDSRTGKTYYVTPEGTTVASAEVAGVAAEAVATGAAVVGEAKRERGKKRRATPAPMEVLMFTDASEAGEPIMYIKPFGELPLNLQRRMRNKHRSFHNIDEDKHEMWEQRVTDLVGWSARTDAQRAMKATRFSEWMADNERSRIPLLVVSSFTWGEC